MQLSIDEIIRDSENAFRQFARYCETVPDKEFYRERNGNWSIAQHLQHLIISTKTSTAAYALPKFILRIVAGKPNRSSRTYDELVNKYLGKLAEGGKAKGRYIPGKLNEKTSKDKMLEKWFSVTGNYLKAIKTNCKESQLDKFIVPHPLLGKITLRELGYFTIYHTHHHLKNLQGRMSESKN